MRIDELHKFSDGTLNNVRTALDDILKRIRMKYLPQIDYTHFYQLSHSEIVDIEKNIRVILFTVKMEILLEPTSDKLMVEHAEFDESNAYVLERFYISAGNPVNEILLKLSLPDHKSILTDSKIEVKRRSVKVKELQERCIIKAFQDHQIKKAKKQAQDLKSMITTSIHKLIIEVKDYELKTKVEA
ncbi:hypothetical protein Tco_0741939 [Tanacetum coccineum]